MICKLALEDGTVFTGVSIGAPGTRTGEVVFNTAMTGYQEIFTDPSYCEQIVTMTFPLIGNYGVNAEDFESARPHLTGFVVKELPLRPSNHRATASVEDFLKEHGIIGLSGIDTRALTRRTRVHGALRGAISTEISDDIELLTRAGSAPVMEGANLVDRVSPARIETWSQRSLLFPLGKGDDRWSAGWHASAAADPCGSQAYANGCHLVAIDCGIKHNILRHLAQTGCRVTVAPAKASAAQIRDLCPDALVVGNGPGDPAAVGETIQLLRELQGTLPILGICLGHQMLALALGAKTYKLRFGHHGANVPVLNTCADRVEITSQNHGFAVDRESLERAGGTVTHVNLNDGSVEGFLHADHQALAVQFHPEASPGPHDAGYLFHRFAEAVKSKSPFAFSLLQ